MPLCKLTNPCWRTLHPASQDIRSLMVQEKQMSATQPLVFLMHQLYHNHPWYSSTDFFFITDSPLLLFFRHSRGGISISFTKALLKLDTEWNPTSSEISRIEESVLESSRQACSILVLLINSKGLIPMIVLNVRLKCVTLKWHMSASSSMGNCCV